jgi:hypothetical protein
VSKPPYLGSLPSLGDEFCHVLAYFLGERRDWNKDRAPLGLGIQLHGRGADPFLDSFQQLQNDALVSRMRGRPKRKQMGKTALVLRLQP